MICVWKDAINHVVTYFVRFGVWAFCSCVAAWVVTPRVAGSSFLWNCLISAFAVSWLPFCQVGNVCVFVGNRACAIPCMVFLFTVGIVFSPLLLLFYVCLVVVCCVKCGKLNAWKWQMAVWKDVFWGAICRLSVIFWCSYVAHFRVFLVIVLSVRELRLHAWISLISCCGCLFFQWGGCGASRKFRMQANPCFCFQGWFWQLGMFENLFGYVGIICYICGLLY